MYSSGWPTAEEGRRFVEDAIGAWADAEWTSAETGEVMTASMYETVTHARAPDRELFTIDQDYEFQVNPSFETQSGVLQQTIVDRTGGQIPVPDGGVDPDYFRRHNATLDWL